MILKIIRIYFAGIIFPALITSPCRAESIDGWQDFRFGMPFDEARALCDGRLLKEDGSTGFYYQIICKETSLARSRFQVRLKFSYSGYLKGIDLIPIFSAGQAQPTYAHIKNVIAEKYGEVCYIDDKFPNSVTSAWARCVPIFAGKEIHLMTIYVI